MLRSLCALLLALLLMASPCLAQLSPDEIAKGAARENQDKLRYIQSNKDQLAQAEAAGKVNIATDLARNLADTYQRPNIYDHKPLDLVEARKWFAYAAAKGNTYANTDAAYWLGTMYWDGIGGPQDRERAKYIWMWAAENKERKAVVKLEQLGYDMQKEREIAFAKAKTYQSQPADTRTQSEMATAGLGILLGVLLLSVLTETPCDAYHRALLMGIYGTPPPGCF